MTQDSHINKLRKHCGCCHNKIELEDDDVLPADVLDLSLHQSVLKLQCSLKEIVDS
jgi:hypothetical protein